MREFLISPGFGTGWSTWSTEHEDFLLFDKGLIELAKRKASEEEVEKYLKLKNIDIFTGGWDDIRVYYLEDDEEFIVEEYDGSESIRIKSKENWK